MIPVGYMLKHVAPCPAGLAAHVADVYSVSPHISPDFADWTPAWRHNGFWLFDSPKVLNEAAHALGADAGGATLFYYEAYKTQFDGQAWRAFHPEPALPTAVVPARHRRLRGYDVVTYSTGAAAECSPLTCNGLAAEIPVNPHGLIPTLDAARGALDSGAFALAEPGPWRILAVYTVEG